MQDVTPSSAPVTTAPEPKKYDRRWAWGLGAVFGAMASYGISRSISDHPAVDVVHMTLLGGAVSGTASALFSHLKHQISVAQIAVSVIVGTAAGAFAISYGAANRIDRYKEEQRQQERDRLIQDAGTKPALDADTNLCAANKLPSGNYTFKYTGLDGEGRIILTCPTPAGQ